MTDIRSRAQTLLDAARPFTTDPLAGRSVIRSALRRDLADGVVALMDDAPAIVRELLAALEAYSPREMRIVGERDAALARAERAEAEIARLTAPCDADTLADRLINAARSEGGTPEERRDNFKAFIAMRNKVIDTICALTASAAKWHSARRILDGAREAHAAATQGKWDAMDHPDDVASVVHRDTGETIAACDAESRDDESVDPIVDARGIVADHAAMGELLRLASGEAK